MAPEPEEEQLASRRRLMRRLSAGMTPDQRLERMAQLQRSCFDLLSSSPEAFARFWRRNLRKRAVRVSYDPLRPV